jgi:N-methylhydantoinase A/oxoprolinase/acetone carboxylase beta subunit
MTPPPRRVGSDTGGTFTDLVLDDGTIAKVPSTPHEPSAAVEHGLVELGVAGPVALGHGTTIATNALLERRGAAVALVTNEGFADIIEIARQDRPSLYDQAVDRPVPLVPRRWRYEVRGRLAADGTELVPFDPATLPELDPGIDVVAVCLLHSDRNPAHERAVREELLARAARSAAGKAVEVTLSCELSPEFREYERTVTTVVSAFVSPVCRAYLERLASVADTVSALTSAGGLIPAADAAAQPGRLLLSGPAGGALAGAEVAAANGWPDAITFDMGGTSTDVGLIVGGASAQRHEMVAGKYHFLLPMVDVRAIGAGGGSIARIDEGGALVVGPESAGAVPGPACYGHGGTAATVTDADLVAGRLPEGVSLPGIGPLDAGAARRALDAAGTTAEAVIAVVDAGMEQALRTVSVARGVDPRRLALVAFGGAGPVHACALADALDMPAVIVPARAGVFSAVGVLGAPHQVDLVASWPAPGEWGGLAEARRQLAEAAAGALRERIGDDAPVVVTETVDCRYVGQSHELRVGSPEEFPAEHERRNGYARPGTPVEVIALRASASAASPVAATDLPGASRAAATGPEVIAEPDCTIWVPPGWAASPGAGGALILTRESP